MTKTLEKQIIELENLLKEDTINKAELALIIARDNRNSMMKADQDQLDALLEKIGWQDTPVFPEKEYETLLKTNNVPQLSSCQLKPLKSDELAKNYEAIIASYKKQFPDKEVVDGRLEFDSLSRAENFFAEQAKKGHAFLAKVEGEDLYFFSDGNGELCHGSKNEIKAYCQKNNIELPKTFNGPNDKENTNKPSFSL